MNPLDSIWDELIEAAQGDKREVQKLVSKAGCVPVTASYSPRTNLPSLIIELDDVSDAGQMNYPRAKGIEVTLCQAAGIAPNVRIAAVSSDHLGMFRSISADLVDIANSSPTGTDAVLSIMARIRAWQEFLSKDEGQDRKSALGLLGELVFLRDIMIPALGSDRAVNAWTGPRGEDKDFLLSGLGIELKTTASSDAKSITIASPSQLEENGLERLVLVVQRFTASEDGESLCDVVRSLRKRLERTDHASLEPLDNKILGLGWSSEEMTGESGRRAYRSSSRQFYDVRDGFPRIRSEDLPTGIGKFSYPVFLNVCRPFIISEMDVAREIEVRSK